MNLKLFMMVFTTIFLAEIGDKTQMATLLYASSSQGNKLVIFLGSASALVLACAIGVAVGSVLSRYIDVKHLSWFAGIGFVAVGIWTIAKA